MGSATSPVSASSPLSAGLKVRSAACRTARLQVPTPIFVAARPGFGRAGFRAVAARTAALTGWVQSQSAGRFALVLSLRCGALALWPCLHLSVLPLLASLAAMVVPHSTGGGKWL